MTRVHFPLTLGAIGLAMALSGELVAQSAVAFDGQLALGAAGATTATPREHTFQVADGQPIRARLFSDEFDTILKLVPPSGEPLENDDFDGTDSQISTVASTGGTWRAVVSAYGDGSGGYRLEISLGAIGTTREIASGELSETDSISAKGHRYDEYSVRVDARSQVVLEMRATDFAPMLVAFGPQGRRYSSEGTGSGGTVSIDIPSAEPGAWRIVATQSETSQAASGSYSVRIVESPTSSTDEERTGSLEESDRRQILGEYFDTFEINGSADRGITLTLTASDFDAYIAARSPSGEWLRDDDSGGESNARLVLPAAAGRWFVIVTSFSPDETGNYTLTITR